MCKEILKDTEWSGLNFFLFLSIVIDLFFMFGVEYVDSVINCSWGYAFWDVVFRRTSTPMYEYLMCNPICPYQAPMGYSWLVELPIALWQLPIYILYWIFGKELRYNYYLSVWYKMFLLFISCCMAFVSNKLVKYVLNEKTSWRMLLFSLLASGEFVASIFYAGQDEVVYVFALMCFLYGNVLHHKWIEILSMIVAVTLNPICLLAIIPVVVMDEKNVLKILGKIFTSCIPLLIFEFIYRDDILLHEYNHIEGNSQHLFLPGVSFVNDLITVPIFPIIYVFLVIYLYIRDSGGKQLNKEKVIIIASVFALLEVFTAGQIGLFYRGMLWLPFFVTYVLMEKNDLINFLLLAVYEVFRTFTIMFPLSNYNGISSDWAVCFEKVKFIQRNQGITMYQFLCSKIGILSNSGLIYSCAVAILLFIIFYNLKHLFLKEDYKTRELNLAKHIFWILGIYVCSVGILAYAFWGNLELLIYH